MLEEEEEEEEEEKEKKFRDWTDEFILFVLTASHLFTISLKYCTFEVTVLLCVTSRSLVKI